MNSTRSSLSKSIIRILGALMRIEIKKNRDGLIALVSTKLKKKKKPKKTSTAGFKLKFSFFRIVAMYY